MVHSITARLLASGDLAALPVHGVSVVRGSDDVIEITVLDEDGDPLDLTGRTVEYAVRMADGDVAPLFSREAELTETTNVCRAVLNAADTGALATATFRGQVWITDEDGRHPGTKASDFKVLEATLLPGEGSTSATPIAQPIRNVADLAALALVESSRLWFGYQLYVIDEDDYFQIRIDSGLSADADHVAALGLTDGWWARWSVGASGGGIVGVANLAALAALASSGYDEGQPLHLDTLKHLYNLEQSALVADGRNVVDALGKAGFQWIRSPQPTGAWYEQAAWEVDPVDGDDEASGEPGEPIKTYDEFNRRVEGAEDYADTTITLLGSVPANDVLRPNVIWKYDDANETFASLWVIGTPTVLYSGSITGGVVNPGNTFPTVLKQAFTDSAIPTSFTASGLVKKLWKRTGGTRQYSWIGKDQGSKTASCAIPANTQDTVPHFGGTTIVNMAVGQTYQILDLPEMPAVQQANPDINSQVVVQTCRIVGNLDGGLYGSAPTAQYRLCSIASGALNNGQALWNCQIEDATLTYFEGAGFPCNIEGGIIHGGGTAADTLLVLSGAHVRFSLTIPTTFQGAIIAAIHAGRIEDLRALLYDTNGDMITVSGQSRVNVKAQGGAGNGGNIVLVRDPGDMCWVDETQVTPASTTDLFPYKVGTLSYDTVSGAAVQFARTGRGLMPATGQSSATLRVFKEAIPGYFESSGVAAQEDVVARHLFVSLDDFLISASSLYNLGVYLVGDIKVSGGIGTVRIRIDGTLGNADGTVIATGTLTNNTFADAGSVFAAAFAGQTDGFLSGRHLIQITFANDTADKTVVLDNLALEIRQS